MFGTDVVPGYTGTPHGWLLRTLRASGPYETLPQRLVATAAHWPDEFDGALRELFKLNTAPQAAAAR